MRIFAIITGSSSGIGKAIAEELLNNEDTQVLGISRKKTIQHQRYRHVSADLGNQTVLQNIDLQIPAGIQKVLLINNAGKIEPIGATETLKPDEVISHFILNVVAVQVLMSIFIRQTDGITDRHIINISSGAGKYPVKGWAAYCASKAAVDALSKVVAAEHPDILVWSMAPGIVDTPMQQTIRNTRESQFAERQRFVDYYEKGELKDPREIARALTKLLDSPEKVTQVVFSLRDLT
jgi:benzil reductase ((S)-benzoin forming)